MRALRVVAAALIVAGLAFMWFAFAAQVEGTVGEGRTFLALPFYGNLFVTVVGLGAAFVIARARPRRDDEQLDWRQPTDPERFPRLTPEYDGGVTGGSARSEQP